MSFATAMFLGFGPGTMEMVVIGIVGLLIFGRRLPEVGRSLGKTFFELRRGMNDIKREMDDAEHLANESEIDPHYRDQNHHYRDPGLRDDDEIVKEAQAFGESVVESDESEFEYESDLAHELENPQQGAPDSENSNSGPIRKQEGDSSPS